MKNSILLFVISVTFISCTITKGTVIKIPKVKGQKWFTKRSLNRYAKEFSEKDWTVEDTSSSIFFDSLRIEN